MTTPLKQQPYIRAQRSFPNKDMKELSVEMDRAYIDIATKINDRTIGTFSLNNSVVTGEQWYLQGTQKQQTIRQVYTILGSGAIGHGIDFSSITGITKIYGTFTDGTNYYPLPYVDITNTNKQVNIVVTPSQIVITSGASAPTVQSAMIVLEWLSNV